MLCTYNAVPSESLFLARQVGTENSHDNGSSMRQGPRWHVRQVSLRKQKRLNGHRSADLDSKGHEGPAGSANVAFLSTGPHIIIICQINIKHQLPFYGRKGSL